MNIAVLQQLSVSAVRELLGRWQLEHDDFHLLALLPEAEQGRVRMLQDLCRDANIGLAGALFPALIHDGELHRNGAVLLRVNHAPPPLLFTGISDADGPRRTANQIADHLANSLDESRDATLFCLFDGLAPNVASHLDSWYLKLANRVRYFGANAGNERFAPEPCLFDGDRLVDDGVLIQLLPGHPGGVLAHGYQSPQRLTLATSTAGNHIHHIDWKPAITAYAQILQEEYQQQLTAENFYNLATHFPFGIIRADGEVLVRIPVAIDGKDVICVGEIPQNAILTLLDARNCEQRAVPLLAADLGTLTSAPSDVLLFYCAGRRMHLGDESMTEVAELAASDQIDGVVGALSLGEIGTSRSGSYPLFHNATLAGMPWPDR